VCEEESASQTPSPRARLTQTTSPSPQALPKLTATPVRTAAPNMPKVAAAKTNGRRLSLYYTKWIKSMMGLSHFQEADVRFRTQRLEMGQTKTSVWFAEVVKTAVKSLCHRIQTGGWALAPVLRWHSYKAKLSEPSCLMRAAPLRWVPDVGGAPAPNWEHHADWNARYIMTWMPAAGCTARHSSRGGARGAGV